MNNQQTDFRTADEKRNTEEYSRTHTAYPQRWEGAWGGGGIQSLYVCLLCSYTTHTVALWFEYFDQEADEKISNPRVESREMRREGATTRSIIKIKWRKIKLTVQVHDRQMQVNSVKRVIALCKTVWRERERERETLKEFASWKCMYWVTYILVITTVCKDTSFWYFFSVKNGVFLRLFTLWKKKEIALLTKQHVLHNRKGLFCQQYASSVLMIPERRLY